MKFRWILPFLLLSPIVNGQDKTSGFIPASGFVPDATTAIKIANAVLVPVYGEKQISSELPLRAELEQGTWIVRGTLNCAPPPAHDLPGKKTLSCEGGTAVVRISKSDGKILFMTHYK
ncbi:NTF2 fold immunity protein [Candidatus Korobacter versatilis]|uniref:NTF2 fold immunity protein n=1 Tax=Candidatus Korobacter versatilis TaxID=658062 RepID=UPI0005A445B6